MEVNEAIRLRIDRLLKEKGWIYNELIKRSGINQTTLSEFKSGRSKTITVRTVEKIALGFGMNLSQFFNDELFKETHEE